MGINFNTEAKSAAIHNAHTDSFYFKEGSAAETKNGLIEILGGIPTSNSSIIYIQVTVTHKYNHHIRQTITTTKMSVVRFAEQLETTIVFPSSARSNKTSSRDTQTSSLPSEDEEVAAASIASATSSATVTTPRHPLWKLITLAFLACLCGAAMLTVLLLWITGTLDKSDSGRSDGDSASSTAARGRDRTSVILQDPIWQRYGRELPGRDYSHVALSADARTLVTANATHVTIYRAEKATVPSLTTNPLQLDGTIGSTTTSSSRTTDIEWKAAAVLAVERTVALSLAGNGRRLAVASAAESGTRFYDDYEYSQWDHGEGRWSLRPEYLDASSTSDDDMSLSLSYEGTQLAVAGPIRSPTAITESSKEDPFSCTRIWTWSSSTTMWMPQASLQYNHIDPYIDVVEEDAATGTATTTTTTSTADADADADARPVEFDEDDHVSAVVMAANGKTVVERLVSQKARVWQRMVRSAKSDVEAGAAGSNRSSNSNENEDDDSSKSHWAPQGQSLPVSVFDSQPSSSSATATGMDISSDGHVLALVHDRAVQVYDYSPEDRQWHAHKAKISVGGRGSSPTSLLPIADVCVSADGLSVGLIVGGAGIAASAQLWQWDGPARAWHFVDSSGDTSLLHAPSPASPWRTVTCAEAGHTLVLHSDELVRVVQVVDG